MFNLQKLKTSLQPAIQNSLRWKNAKLVKKMCSCKTNGVLRYFGIFAFLFTVTTVFRYILGESEYYLRSENGTGQVCVLMEGRLGNNMFQYASAYGISKEKNFTFIIQENADIFSVFDKLDVKKDNSGMCDRFKVLRESVNCANSINKYEMSKGRNYRLATWLQSWTYFQNVDDEIRKQFSFNKRIGDDARRVFNDHSRKYNIKDPSLVTFIGVHARRGDITKNPRFTSYGYLVPDEKYYLKAFKIMRKYFINVLFIVSTNDRAWVKNKLLFDDVTLIEDGNSPEVDMATLTLCNHTIMSVGTFGWWTAYLTNGLTIYYRHPARKGSELRTEFSSDMLDYFYPGWVGLE